MVNRDAMPKSYAKVTAALYSKKHPIVVDNTPKGRFGSTQRDEYKLSNNRRFGKYPINNIQAYMNHFTSLEAIVSSLTVLFS